MKNLISFIVVAIIATSVSAGTFYNGSGMLTWSTTTTDTLFSFTGANAETSAVFAVTPDMTAQLNIVSGGDSVNVVMYPQFSAYNGNTKTSSITDVGDAPSAWFVNTWCDVDSADFSYVTATGKQSAVSIGPSCPARWCRIIVAGHATDNDKVTATTGVVVVTRYE